MRQPSFYVKRLKKVKISDKMSPIWSLFHVIWLAQSFEFGNTLGVEIVTNLSEFGDGIFNFKESKEFVEIPEVTYPELNIFCYNGKT